MSVPAHVSAAANTVTNFLNYVTATQVTPPVTGSETDRGRAALKGYIANVLFNTGNPEGESFRRNILDGQSSATVANIRRQLDGEAAAWSPTGPDWEKSETGADVTYAGRLFQLYTEVRFKAGAAAPEIYVEID